jgi:putative hemolysin
LILILFGEVLPKLAAAQVPVTFAKFASVPLLLVHRLLTPVRVASSVLVIGPLARLIAPSTRPPNLSPQELDSLLSLSQTQGVIDPQEEQLLQQVFALGQLKVRDLMIPRVDIRAFDLDDDPAHLVQLIHRTRLRHVPVYRGDLDHIQGLIYSRQVLLNPPRTALQLNKLVRQVRYVPQMQRADQLLVEMRKTGTTIAIAVDEYGGTAGLITLEDVVEQMVGDIAGEYERNSEPQVASIAPGVWRVDADLSVHEWSDFFGHNREVQGAAALELVSTLGGLVMALLGRLPKPGDHVTVGNVVITVETMKQKRIETLRIELREPANKTPDSSTEP